MPVSSYQAQQVLAELRKRLGLENKGPSPDTGGVRVSTITIIEDEEVKPAERVAPPVVARTVIDGDTYAPAVSRELERRAGSFMQPPVAPRNAANRIPKTGRRPTPPAPARHLGDAD